MPTLRLALIAAVLSAGCATSHMNEMHTRAQAETAAAILAADQAAAAAIVEQDLFAGLSEAEAAEMQAMMGAWTAHMTPGEHHTHLMARAGTYDTHFQWWQAPEAPSESANGVAVLRPVLGGLFLAEESESAEMIPGLVWRGMGFTGFDNTTGKLLMVWMDSAGSGMYFAEGGCNVDCTETVAEGKGTDAMSGTTKHYRYVTRELEPGRSRFQIWELGEDDEYWLMMQAEYVRRA